MKFLALPTFLLFGLMVNSVTAQLAPDTQLQVDSLRNVAESSLEDSTRVKALAQWAALIASTGSAKNQKLHLEVIQICERHLSGELTDREALFYRGRLAASQSFAGINLFLKGNFPEALRYQLQALDAFSLADNKARMAVCHIVIGAVFKSQHQFSDAMAHFEEALALNLVIDHQAGVALAYNNIGTVQEEQKFWAEAAINFRKSLAIYQQLGEKRGMGTELINLGRVKEVRGELDSARYYYQRSLEIRLDIDDRQGLIFCHARLGELAFLTGDYPQAKVHGLASLRLANDKGYPRGQRDACEILSKVFKQQGDYKQALLYQELFVTYKDSLASEESVRAVTEAEYSYKFEKDSIRQAMAQQEIASQLRMEEVKNEQQRQATSFLYGGLALTVLMGLIIYNRYRKTRHQKNIIEQQKHEVDEAYQALSKRDDEKEVLLKEIHHRVKNNLQVISSLLELQTQNIDDEDVLTAVEDGQSRVKAMALIHQKLYQNKDIGSISFEEYARQLIRQIASIYPAGKNVRYEIDAPPIGLDIDTAVPLGLILNELVTNAYKYAFEANSEGLLHVKLEPAGSGSFLLQVTDNGVGLPADFDLKKARSLGLRLVRRLSQQLYGNASYQNHQGAAFTIEFKDTMARKEVL